MKKTRLSGLVFFSVAYMWYDERIEHIGFYRYGRYVIEVLIMKKEVFTYETTYDVAYKIDELMFIG